MLRIRPFLGILALIICSVSLVAEDKLNEKRILLPYNSAVATNFTVHTRGDGEVQISYNDVHNSLMFSSQMDILIRPIVAIEILPSIVEASIGGTVVLPVAVLGFINGVDGEKAYFDDCVQVSFDVDIVESSRVRYQSNNVMPGIGKNSCRSFSFECTAVGNSRIWISYSQNKDIKSSAIVGCYGPIIVNQPTESSVLSLGSSIDIAFEGGPRPWSMYPEGHYTKATAVNSSLVSITEIKDRYRYNKELHVYRTKCLDYGEAEITLEAGNKKSPTLMNPASTSTSVKINCSKPKTLIIQHQLSKSTCPQSDFVFKLEKNRKIELDVLVLDDNGNSFYNFSALYFDWSMDGNGEFQKTNGINEEVIGAKGYSTITRSFQVISQLTTARSKVRGRITGYHESFGVDSFDVFREVEIILTDPIVTEEDNISLLKHPSYKKSITIEKGSGHFSVDYSPKDIINIHMKPNSRTIDIVPLNVGSGVITITDLCLSYPKHTIDFSVVEALDVNLDLVDKIELGSTVKGTFYVLDHRGMKMPSSLHSILNVVTSNNFLEISDVKPIDDYITSFSVKAIDIGVSKVIIRSQSDDLKAVQSSAIEVQVFSPLQIVPSNITLIVGNHFQANFIGGPQTQRNIEFLIDDPSLASVANNGLIKALKIGKTKLTAKATSINNFEYSRAEVEVHVVPLKKIKIWSPVNQIVLGSHMPLYLIGSSEQHETPFMCGQAEPALNVTWTLSNEKIAAIESSFQKFGIVDSVTDQIAARFSAKTVGTVTVKARVEVTVPPNSRDTEQIWRSIILTDSVQINVLTTFAPYLAPSFAATGMTQEIANTKVLLLSPNAELMLHFNHLDQIEYKILNSSSVRLINDTELVLQAGDQQEHALLLLTRDVHKTGLIEFYSYVVHVERVRYLSLEFFDTTFIQEKSSTISIDVFPLGSESHLVVNFFDNHGRKFDSVKSNLKWHLSRNDIITVLSEPLDNTLKIRALKEGSVVMQVTDQVNQVGAFYKINVGALGGGDDGGSEGEQTVVSAAGEAVGRLEDSAKCSPSSSLQSPLPSSSSSSSSMSDSFYYSTTLIFGTLLLAVMFYFIIRYLATIPLGGKVKEYGAYPQQTVGSTGDMSFNDRSPSRSSPRRVVDYQNTSNTTLGSNTLLTPSISRTRLVSSPSLLQSPSSPSVNSPSTPISPRVGRSLYSTRQNFQ